MILSNTAILTALKEGAIAITPFNPDQLGSNSYDVRLGNTLAVYDSVDLDSRKENTISLIEIPETGYRLEPGKLYLGVTAEYTETWQHVPFLEGKSSIGRLGINIHATAGKGDIGFCGHWTLEISVIQPVIVYPNMPIGQLIYFQVAGECDNLYYRKSSAKYNNDAPIPMPSKQHLNRW